MSNSSVKFAGVGCVVELMQGGRPLLAWVLEEQSGQLRLWSINKREMKMAAGRVLPWLGPSCGNVGSRQEIQERLEQHRKRRDELAAGLDMLQIWELAQGEIRQADARWFAELIWPEPDADQVASMGQALLAQKTHFKFSPPVFEVYPEELVAQRQEKQREEEARMELATVGAEIFRKLYEASRQRRVLPENERPKFAGEGGAIAVALAELLKARIADPDAHDADGLWKRLIKALPAKMGQGALGQPGFTPAVAAKLEDEPHLPLMLATAWGLVPEHYNFWLDRADYNPAADWHLPYQKEIDDISEAVDKFLKAAENNELPKIERCENEVVSVDPDSTRDWDDAFSIGRSPDGGYRLKVALACPALGWPFESSAGENGEHAPGRKPGLDRAVFRRATSLYLPEAVYFMLPSTLALSCYSLEAGKLRPALLLWLEFDPAGNMLAFEPRLAAVRVKANLTQKYCEAMLNGDNGNSAGAVSALPEDKAALAAMFQNGLALAEKLQARRLENGAIITERPEIDIVVKADDEGVSVALERAAAVPRTQLLVSELMIAATLALTQWCMENAIPLLYRSQDVALPREFAGIWRREEEIARVLKALPPSLLGLEPKPHAGLGVKFYSSFTAPIRRYPDLLNESQVVCRLQTGQPRLSKDELAALLPQLNSRLDQAGQIQRFRPRYWKLLFFQQQEQQAQRRKTRLNYWDAVITEENSYFVGVMLEAAQLYLRGPRQLFGGRTVPGTPVRVRLGKINPLRNEIQIMEVLEE
ncbi:MAG: RNB domain-containing ribonuclease [Deltaproteobacteria bacterium]|jgi:exoribonuclease-2|nr:RNB domain-containing ribonuclease [Deltaproteobacteria bacterium]